MSGKKSILIADSDRALVNQIAQRCQFLGLETIKAYDARTTFELILEFRPHIICIDSGLQANGMTVCEVLSRDDEYSKIPVIVLVDKGRPFDLNTTDRLCAYRIIKTARILESVEPVVFELTDLRPVTRPRPSR